MDENGIMQIGIVGVGGHGMGNVYPHVHNNPKMRIKAVCDLIDKQIERGVKAFNPDYATKDYSDMLKDPEIDAIVSSTYDPYHAPIAIACMRGGKNVFIEKPMGINLEECQECVRTEKETGKFLQVGTNRRFAPIYMDARKALKEASVPPELQHHGRSAPVIYYSITDDPRNHVPGSDDELGGRLNREICHIFDVTTYWMESEPKTIYAAGSDQRGVLTITYENGGIVNIIEGGIGHISNPKEIMEVYAESVVVRINCFLKLRVASDDCIDEVYYEGFEHGSPGKIQSDLDLELEYFKAMQEKARYFVDNGVYSAPTREDRVKRWEALVAAGGAKPPESEKTGYRGMDKGHYNEIEMFRRAVLSNGPSPVGAVDGARAFVMGLTAAEAMKTGKIMEIDQSLYML